MRSPPPAEALRIGGIEPFSISDWPGQLAAVVFVQGCPWRCAYCHNPHLQDRDAPGTGVPGWAQLRPWFERRRGLIDGVVFSGGEPTLDPALPAAMAELRAMGHRIALHTAGTHPVRLAALLPLVDWVGLDIKAPLHDEAAHAAVTGARHGAKNVRRCLALLAGSGVDFECRSTIHPALHDADALESMAAGLQAAGVRHWALQPVRASGATLPACPPGWPSAAELDALRRRVPGLLMRTEAG